MAAYVLNVVSWLVQAVGFWWFGLAFGLDLPPPAYIVLMIAANLVSAFPLTFQNIGTYEVVMLEVLAAWGVNREDALAYTIATHLLMNLWIIVLGFGALLMMRIRPGELFSMRPGRL